MATIGRQYYSCIIQVATRTNSIVTAQILQSHDRAYHTGNNSKGCKVVNIGHIPPDILVDGVDEVTDPHQEGNK